MPPSDDEYAVTARRALMAVAQSLDRALGGREPSRSAARLSLLEIPGWRSARPFSATKT
jgi:hypothetical protein